MMSNSTKDKCEAGGQLAKGNAKLHPWTKCGRVYHTACIVFNKERVCCVCLVIKGPLSSGSTKSSTPAKRGNGGGGPGTSVSAGRRTSIPTNNNSDRVNLNNTSNSINNINHDNHNNNNKFCNLNSNISNSPSDQALTLSDNLITRLFERLHALGNKLDTITGDLNARIIQNTQAIEFIREEMRKDRYEFGAKLANLENNLVASDGVSVEVDDTSPRSSAVRRHKRRNTLSVPSQRFTNSSRRFSSSSSLVIGGLPVGAEGVDLRLTAFSVLRALDTGLVDQEVVSARFIGSARSVSLSSSTQTDSPSRPRSILVVMYTDSIVSVIIRAKIRKGRLTHH